MAGVVVRNFGGHAALLPRIKRGIGRLTDGRVVALMVDPNIAVKVGTDVTGVAKIVLMLSTDSTRTAFTAAVSYTPPVAPCSSTVIGVASICVGTDNSVWVAWAGTDNSLHCTKWTYSAGVFTFVADQVVVAADGTISNKYRVIDIDVAGTNNPLISTYESKATSGQGAWARFYVRRNDGTTWIKAHEADLIGTLFIRPGSEDITAAWHLDGIVSNVGKFLTYYSKTSTTTDSGDTVKEVNYNTSTGAANSATVLGSWFTNRNQNRAAGTRRAWIWKLNSGSVGMWLWAGTVGAAVPEFFASKLTTGLYGTPIVTIVGSTPVVALNAFFKIAMDFNPGMSIAATYSDNRLIFGFIGYGKTYARIFREVMFRYNNITDYGIAFVDSTPRPLDGSIGIEDGPIAIYGTDNSRLTSATNTFNFLCVYGYKETDPATGHYKIVRFVAEDIYDAPGAKIPASLEVEPNNRPNFQVNVNPIAAYLNLYGKIEIQVATDTAFTANVRSAIQSDSSFQYFGSIDADPGTNKVVTVSGSLLNLPLFSRIAGLGSWYWRARIVSDKGTAGAWSDYNEFYVNHPPTAIAQSPKDTDTILYTGNVTFSWKFTDTEPTDTQSAYYVKVIRTDTGVAVIDTGWVTSTAKSVSLAVGSSLKEIPLQWSVALKDSDGTAGPFTAVKTFLTGDAPVVALTSPSDSLATLNLNPTFEVDASDWTGTNGTFARDTTQHEAGTASGKLTPNGTSPAPEVSTGFINVTQYYEYPVDVWVYTPTTWAGGIGVRVDWYTSGSVFISSSTTTLASVTGATWTNIKARFNAPATAAKAKMIAFIAGTPGAINTLFIDEARFKDVSIITTALPVFSWSFTGSGSRTQRSFRVVVVRDVDQAVVGDSLWVQSSSLSYAFASQILSNTTAYTVTLYVQDTGGLQSNVSLGFTTQWIHPAQPSPMTIVQDGFKVTVGWDASDVDTDFISWRVWRRYRVSALPEMDFDASATIWQLVYETTDPLVNQYLDYLSPLNKSADYTVTQIADRFGSVIDSIISSTVTITCASDRYYFVPENLVGTIASYQAAFVTADDFTDEVEQETIHVIGRGRQVQVGDDLGYTGQLTIKLRNVSSARGDREFLEYLASNKTDNVWIRSPFGDVLLVRLGNLHFTRLAGVGATNGAGVISDLGDLTVPYSQVINDNLPVTRLNS